MFVVTPSGVLGQWLIETSDPALIGGDNNRKGILIKTGLLQAAIYLETKKNPEHLIINKIKLADPTQFPSILGDLFSGLCKTQYVVWDCVSASRSYSGYHQ